VRIEAIERGSGSAHIGFAIDEIDEALYRR